MRHMRKRAQLGRSLGVDLAYKCCCGREHGHPDCNHVTFEEGY